MQHAKKETLLEFKAEAAAVSGRGLYRNLRNDVESIPSTPILAWLWNWVLSRSLYFNAAWVLCIWRIY